MPEATADIAPRRLPGGGEAYIFNPQKFDKEAQETLGRYKSWLGETGKNEDQLEEEQEYLTKLRKWEEKFSGQIPKDWADPFAGSGWHYITKNTQDPLVPLTDIQIIAAVEHPLWHCPTELGENRPLTAVQLNLLAKQETISPNTFRDIAERQIVMGVNKDVVNKAKETNGRHWATRDIESLTEGFEKLAEAVAPPKKPS